MARALKNVDGRGSRIGNRAQVAGCSDCCGDVRPLYYLACPCTGYEFFPCAVPDEPCVFVDTRSVIGGLSGDALLEAIGPADAPEGVIVRLNGICYRLRNLVYGEADTGVFALPEGAALFGGNGVELERMEDCVEGCAAVNIGPEYFEAFLCSGCEIERRFFVCAFAAQGMTLVYGSFSTYTLCIDRTIGYSAAQVEAIPGDIEIINEPTTPMIWTGSGSRPTQTPATSCCFSSGIGDCNPNDCLSGGDWRSFGSSLDGGNWFQVDTCCGTVAGLTYTVELVFTRTQTNVIGPGDVLTTSITAVVDSVVPRGGISGGADVNMTITTRSIRPAQGIDLTTESPASIYLEPRCCIQAHPALPNINRFEAHDPLREIPDYPGYYYSARRQIESDVALARRRAWNDSGWGAFLQLGFLDESSAYNSTGTTIQDTSCLRHSFQHTETIVTDNVTTGVVINLVTQRVQDNAFPCAYIAQCGPNGWGGLEGMMP